MDLKRVAVALLAALVLAVGASYFVYVKLREQRAQQPHTVKIVAATKPLQAGAALSSDNVTMIDWPSNMPLTGSFAKAEDVVGRSLIYPVTENQPILERDVAAAGSGIGITVKIPEGMRATSLRSNEVMGVAGFLYPGSHVDVLLTLRPEGSSTPQTETILQNVEVLTAGQRIEPDPQGKPETVNVVTLLLTPQDSEKVVLASQQGSIQFVLRNGADKTTSDTRPVLMTELVTGPKKEAAPKRVTTKLAPGKQPPHEFYVVETIAGEKRTSEKF